MSYLIQVIYINAIDHTVISARIFQQPIRHCQGIFIKEIFAFRIEAIRVDTREYKIGGCH